MNFLGARASQTDGFSGRTCISNRWILTVYVRACIRDGRAGILGVVYFAARYVNHPDRIMRALPALLILILLLPQAIRAQTLETENVVLITLDGLRWEEVFGGADSLLLHDERYVDDSDALAERFWAPDSDERRKLLMPFFWDTVVGQGQLYGNRTFGSRVDVTNNHLFSYPGYNEILTGRADDRIDSNDKRPNVNVTILEYVNGLDAFQGRVAAFGSWDVFPYIINEERSGVPVNAGFEPAGGNDLTERERFLTELQGQIPSPWGSVRLDAFTHHFAKEHLMKNRPRLLYIAYGETDDFAHDGEYDSYLEAAYRTDAFIRDLWNWVQTADGYRDRTTLLITTDHGRGEAEEWTSHGSNVDGAREIWMAAIGPDTPARGEVRADEGHFQDQVAATVAAFLGLDYEDRFEVGKPVSAMLGR